MQAVVVKVVIYYLEGCFVLWCFVIVEAVGYVFVLNGIQRAELVFKKVT
jgi:hypothetical protein